MTLTSTRTYPGVALLLLTAGLLPGRAQSVPATELASVTLPDAPSTVLTQQSVPTQQGVPAQQAIPPGQGVPAAQGTPDQQKPSEPETEAQRKQREYEQAEREVQAQERQRIALVVPNFNTVLSGQAVPLSKGQKTRLALHATADPFNVVGAFFLAGISEVSASHRGYGWGPEGYFKRVGANLADVVDGTMLAGAVYPILLHQDPRFFRQATGPFRSRLRHALVAPFVCRGDNGHPQPNFSNILGNFTAGVISNAYYPSDETGIRLSMVNSSIVTLEGSLGNIGLEFAPDVSAWLHRRRHPVQP